MSGGQPAQPVMPDPRGFQKSHPDGRHGGGLGLFADGVGFQIHVLACVGKNGRERAAQLPTLYSFISGKHPVKIAEVTPFGVEEKAAFVK